MENQLLFQLHERQADLDRLNTSSSTAGRSTGTRRTITNNNRRDSFQQNPKAGLAYVSPFIKKANEIAKARSKTAVQKLRLNRAMSTPPDTKVDMQFASKPGLFDPTMHKQEIFKLEPKNKPVAAPSTAAPTGLKKLYSTAMTKRTFGVSSMCTS